jgi:hypothetical protein
MESRPLPVPDPTSETSETTASLAEDLPELYRTILDRVADLELAGARLDAGRIRASATRAYSNAWDAAALRELTNLLSRADRQLARPTHQRTWSLRRRTVAAR